MAINIDENYVPPVLEYDENNRAKITTHLGNTYTLRKLSDGEYLQAMSSGGEARPDISMVAVVAAALVEPSMTQQQVKTNLYDGELMILFGAISKYHSVVMDFLKNMGMGTL